MINKLTREEAGRLSSMLKQIELGQDDEAARMLVSAVRERISDLYDRVWESKNGERVKEDGIEYTYNHSMDSQQFIDKTKYEMSKEFQDRLNKLNNPKKIFKQNDMKVKFKQKEGTNCGIYALANVLDNKDYLRFLNSDYKNGHRMYDLNNILRTQCEDYHIECIHKDFINAKLPQSFSLYPTDINKIAPLIIIVSKKQDDIRHAIACHSFNDKTIDLIDSTKEDIITTTFNNIHDVYKFVHSIYVFEMNDIKEEGYVMLSYQ